MSIKRRSKLRTYLGAKCRVLEIIVNIKKPERIKTVQYIKTLHGKYFEYRSDNLNLLQKMELKDSRNCKNIRR